MAQNLSKVRNQVLKMVSAKSKMVDKGFGITPEAKARYVECDYVIDTSKRTPKNQNPKMTE